MKIPDDFQFSQASLEDYRECPRRFELKYLLRLSWPGIKVKPVSGYEFALYQGILFHRMVFQHITGIPEERLKENISDREMAGWWKNYLESKLYYGKVFPEVILSGSTGEHFLVAKYDLIKIEDDKITIIDWKTSKKIPDRNYLKERIQTRLYLYLLVKEGIYVYNNHRSFEPEKVQMIYWFVNFPENPVTFFYDSFLYRGDEKYLMSIIREIKSGKEFAKTDATVNCRYCVYRSLCDRGKEAGSAGEFEGQTDFIENFDSEFDFEQIGEQWF